MHNTDWDVRFLEQAREMSSWSKDPTRKVGAVIVGNRKQIIAQGYNGFPRGLKDTDERLNDKTVKNLLMVHAEMNAILNAALNGTSTVGSTLYVHGLPCCHECAKGIIQADIVKVVMGTRTVSAKWDSSIKLALEMFDEAGVEYQFLGENHDVINISDYIDYCITQDTAVELFKTIKDSIKENTVINFTDTFTSDFFIDGLIAEFLKTDFSEQFLKNITFNMGTEIIHPFDINM